MAAAVLWVGAGRRLRHGATSWTLALVARVLAVSIVAARLEPQVAAIAVAAGLLALSMTLQGNAVLAHQSKHLPPWVHTAAMAAVAVPLALLGTDPANAVLFGGLFFGSLLATLTMIALHSPAAPNAIGRRRLVLSATFGFGAALFYVRGGAAALPAA